MRAILHGATPDAMQVRRSTGLSNLLQYCSHGFRLITFDSPMAEPSTLHAVGMHPDGGTRCPAQRCPMRVVPDDKSTLQHFCFEHLPRRGGDVNLEVYEEGEVLTIVSRRDVGEGEELYLDYGQTYDRSSYKG